MSKDMYYITVDCFKIVRNLFLWDLVSRSLLLLCQFLKQGERLECIRWSLEVVSVYEMVLKILNPGWGWLKLEGFILVTLYRFFVKAWQVRKQRGFYWPIYKSSKKHAGLKSQVSTCATTTTPTPTPTMKITKNKATTIYTRRTRTTRKTTTTVTTTTTRTTTTTNSFFLFQG